MIATIPTCAKRAGKMIAAAWGGRMSAYYPNFSAEPLARVHFVVGVTPGAHRQPDMQWLESEIANEVRTWGDRFETLIRDGGVARTLKVGDILATATPPPSLPATATATPPPKP